ncbi:cation:proton antiporter [Neorhodopirellula pilleata]|uniref:Inner membrane protein YbaL n=1 Tax=Neorhodopirellula pilleata TaxID=2714738 RepID=A0A5C6ANC2_9BACT|nr:cation:proton antiporter [Neorhodopirellula pilleata]TWU01505.1 Inner membrane protein YbaL [Neorhodopirellula pilleata]
MTQSLIHDLFLILTAGLIAAMICRSLKSSVLIGYLLVGAVLGRGISGWVLDENHELEHFAEAGVFLLLFSIGLEFSIDELKRLGRNFVIGGAVQMLLVILPVSAALMSWQMDWQSSVLIASAVAFSSTVLVFKSLSEWGQVQKPHGQRAIGILLFQDAALVPLLLILPMLTGDQPAAGFSRYASTVGVSFAFVISIIALRHALARWLIPWFAGYRSPEMVILFTIVSLGGVTLAAYHIGLPPAVGAFAAGLIFNGNRWTSQIDALVLPFRETFAAVFFVGLGLILDPRLFWNEPLLIGGMLFSLIVVKAIAATVALHLTGMNWRHSFAMGIGLAHVGEFAFVLALVGLEANVLTEIHYQRIVAIAVGSLLLTPPLMKWGLRKIHDPVEANDSVRLDTSVSIQGHRTTVIGAGPIGTRVAAQFETMGKDVCLIDFSPMNLHAFAQAGFRTIAGDATNPKILELAEADQSSVIVVCVADDKAAMRIVRAIRRVNREAKLIVRCRYQSNVSKLRRLGADNIISEEIEATMALLRMLGSAEN